MSRGEFSVCVFYADEKYEYTKRFVTAPEAMNEFTLQTSSIMAKTGAVARVIITDGGDCTNAEWKYGEGIVFPPQG